MAFPRDNYIIRCTKDEFGTSSKDNAMTTCEFEVDRPETISVTELVNGVPTDVQVNIAGVKTQPIWLVTHDPKDEAKAKAALERTNKRLVEEFDLPPVTDPTNPQIQMKGKLFHARLSGKSEPVYKTQSAADKAAGKPLEILVNPVNGQPENRQTIIIEKVYGPANVDPSKPF